MKKLLFLGLAVVALAGITSCGGDDAKPAKIIIDGENVNGIIKAYVIDEGSYCPQCKTDAPGDVREITFVLTDGEFIFGTDGFIDEFVEGDNDLWVELNTYSMNEDVTFEPGEFDIWDWWCGGGNSGAWLNTYWIDELNYIYYYGFDGTVNITQKGSTYGFIFDGLVYDYQDPIAVRAEGCIGGGYNKVDISGGFKAKFIEISEEVWNNWD